MDKRLGFHYFQDLNHYQNRDLALWLPELKSLDAGWLVLKSGVSQAIPEDFISGLVEAGIHPVIHFDLQVNGTTRPEDLRLLLTEYAKWGAKHAIFFKSPNTKSAWLEGTWSQGDLVERFLDRYLPFIRLAEQCGMTPVFPPLQPGGDYWDLSFLKKLLQLVQQRKSLDFESNLHMAISAQTFGKPLTWGTGGTAKWKSPRPYSKTEIGEEDHVGFNTWQWYADIVKSILNIAPKILLFFFGASDISSNTLDPALSFETLVGLIQDASGKGEQQVTLPENVLGCMFWLLSFEPSDPLEKTAWYDTSGKPKSVSVSTYKDRLGQTRKQAVEFSVADRVAEWMYPIDHYLLLPSYDWGVPENTIDRIRPIIRESRPTIGFSLFEAMNARKVTIWNENSVFSENDIQMLREAGCLVDEQVISSINAAV